MTSSRASVSAPPPPLATVPATVSAMAISRTSRTSLQSPPTAAAVASLLGAKETAEVDVGGEVHPDGHEDHRAGHEDHRDHQADLRGGPGRAAAGLLRPVAAHLGGELDQRAGERRTELLRLQQRADELRQARREVAVAEVLQGRPAARSHVHHVQAGQDLLAEGAADARPDPGHAGTEAQPGADGDREHVEEVGELALDLVLALLDLAAQPGVGPHQADE